MKAAMRLAVGRFILLCGVIQNVLAVADKMIPPDISNMTCNLANGKEGICVYAYLCHNNVINTDGTAILDLRYSDDCEDYFLKCCSRESPCMERTGTCLPKGQCLTDLNVSHNKMFKESDDCDWSGYQCCPNDSIKQGSTNTDSSNSDDREENCDEDSICVPDDQCMVNADGLNLLQPRKTVCRGWRTCCPRDQIKRNDSTTCESVGGTCIRKEKCEMPISINVRTALCADQEFECCMADNQPTSTREPTFEGKKCHNNNGICTPQTKCKAFKYTDRKKECGGLVCCGQESTTTTSPDNQSTTQQSDDDAEGPHDVTCALLGGTCEADRYCQQKAEQQSVDCVDDSVCCLSKMSREVLTDSVEVSELKDCGYRNEDGIKFSTINRKDGEAQYGEFPWVVAILFDESSNVKLRCSGTLIDPEVVLTTADCVRSYRNKPEQLIIRAGEWDMGSNMEPIPHQERRVLKVKVHDKFHLHTLLNNIALLFLDDKFDLNPTINTVCIPYQDFAIDNGYVIATGWGTTPQNRTKYQQILKSIELPYIDKSICERTLRRATHNRNFKLDPSFLCAGGEYGRDNCHGDAGSPVMFPIPDSSDIRYYAVGMVSWGVGCGRSGIPSVYTDIGKFREWIDTKIDEENLHSQYYDFQPQD